MTDIAIKVENLSKRYRIGLKEEIHDTFAGALADLVRRPGRNLRRLRRLTTFGRNDEQGEDILWALRDVSFEVKHGEVIGIIGRNGAGKSTLLKILSRITEPTAGRIVLNGRVASLLEVGTGFHPELTGRENVYLNGVILGMRRREIERKFDEIVDFAGVEKFIDTPVKRYSSGMQVRLAFAVAAHLEPEILLVDEVLAVGDVVFQKKCLGKMDEVSKGGRTVFFVSHHMGMIRGLCERAILLENGKLQLDDVSDQVISRYLEEAQENQPKGVVVFTKEEQKNWDWQTVELSSVSILQDNEVVSGTVRSEQPFEIRIEYILKRDVSPFRVKLRLFTQDGIEVFRSDDTVLNRDLTYRAEGRYVNSCFIPANLLNARRYKVWVGADSPALRDYVPYSPAVSFDVVNTIDLSISRSHTGVVDPVLHWQCVKQ